MDELIKKLSVALAYNDDGINGYYKMTEVDEEVKEELLKISKERGNQEAERCNIVSKMEIAVAFLMLKTLSEKDKNIMANEMLMLSKQLCDLKSE